MANEKIPKNSLVVILLLSGAIVLTAAYSFLDLGWYVTSYSRTAASPLYDKMPDVPECQRCNLIFVSLDGLRGDMEGYENPKKSSLTPHFDAIASHSINFLNAYTNSFFTTSNLMTVFTSLFPSTHGIEPGSSDPISSSYKTISLLLAGQNYDTYWIAPHKLHSFESGRGFSKGFRHVLPPIFQRRFGWPPPNKTPELQIKQLEAQLPNGRFPKDKPFFAFIHSSVSDLPYELPQQQVSPDIGLMVPLTKDQLLGQTAEMLASNPEAILSSVPAASLKHLRKLVKDCARFKDLQRCLKGAHKHELLDAIGAWQLKLAGELFSPLESALVRRKELDGFKRAYRQTVKDNDKELGQLWDWFEAKGLLANSVIVIFGDRGEQLFEHGRGGHFTFYDNTTHVPLIIYSPKLRHGVQLKSLASLVDILPTVFSLIGSPISRQAQGRDLLHNGNQKYVFGSALGNDYVRDANWKYIHLSNGQEQLFYLPADPEETQNLIDSRNPTVKSALSRLLKARRSWYLSQT